MRDTQAILQACAAQGLTVRRTARDHWLVSNGSGQTSLSNTPGDHRSIPNAIARLRRLGLIWPPVKPARNHKGDTMPLSTYIVGHLTGHQRTPLDLARRLNVGENAVKDALAQLKARGTVIEHTPGHWRLTPGTATPHHVGGRNAVRNAALTMLENGPVTASEFRRRLSADLGRSPGTISGIITRLERSGLITSNGIGRGANRVYSLPHSEPSPAAEPKPAAEPEQLPEPAVPEPAPMPPLALVTANSDRPITAEALRLELAEIMLERLRREYSDDTAALALKLLS